MLTKVEPKLVPNPIYSLRKGGGGWKGGISYISKRYTKANHKCLQLDESIHIIYLDSNHLYVYAMPKLLPTSGFKYIGPKKFDLNKDTRDSSKGCVLKANIEYRKELRELNNY